MNFSDYIIKAFERSVFMGSVTIIFIIPLLALALMGSSLIGAVTGGDRTAVVLPYEPEKGIVWECDIPIGPVELVETEVDGTTQVFYFRSTWGTDMVGYFGDLAKQIITKDYSKQEYTYGYLYKITFTDANGNELKYYAETNMNFDSIYIDTVNIYAPGEYYAFDYTVTAQQPLEGEYGWYNQDYTYRTEHYKAEYSPTKTFTIVHTDEIESDKEYYYSVEYGLIDGYKRENETVNIKYKITDGEVEILEENQKITQNTTDNVAEP